jgi:outer membrane protein
MKNQSMFPRSRARRAAAVLACCLAGAAAAQPAAEASPPAPRNEGAVGAGLIAGPRYAGSDDSRVRLLPFISYRWGNGCFAGIESGLGCSFSGRSDLRYGLRLTPDFGRDEDDSPDLRGLGDVDRRIELGGFAEWRRPGGLSLQAAWRYGSGNDRDGSVVELGAGYVLPLPVRSRVSAGLEIHLANQAYMQQYFGVDAQQSARSGLAPYTPDAGLRDVRAKLSLMHPLGLRWGLNASVAAVRLSADAADSPLVRERSYLTGLVGLAYRF